MYSREGVRHSEASKGRDASSFLRLKAFLRRIGYKVVPPPTHPKTNKAVRATELLQQIVCRQQSQSNRLPVFSRLLPPFSVSCPFGSLWSPIRSIFPRGFDFPEVFRHLILRMWWILGPLFLETVKYRGACVKGLEVGVPTGMRVALLERSGPQMGDLETHTNRGDSREDCQGRTRALAGRVTKKLKTGGDSSHGADIHHDKLQKRGEETWP